MELLTSCRVYFEEFNYPNINSLDDDQLADVFHKDNRYALLSWIVRIISTEFVPPNEYSLAAENDMATYFYENGFCSNSQKIKFVKGSGLDIKEEITIFKRIFNFMHNIKGKNLLQNSTEAELTVSKISDFLNQRVNIFPMNGPQKEFSKENRQAKMNLYTSILTKLECDIAKLQITEDEAKRESQEPFGNVGFEMMLKEFQNQANKIAKVNSTIKCCFKRTTPCKRLLENDKELLEECRKEVADVLEHIQNYDGILKTIENYPSHTQHDNDLEDMAKIVNSQALLCTEIMQLKKETSSS